MLRIHGTHNGVALTGRELCLPQLLKRECVASDALGEFLLKEIAVDVEGFAILLDEGFIEKRSRQTFRLVALYGFARRA
jgi:hypothetical protein